MNTISANLCKCNNCNNIYIDQNPQINATVYEVPTSKYSDLQYIQEKEENFWGCPVCNTDSYLIDVTILRITINHWSDYLKLNLKQLPFDSLKRVFKNGYENVYHYNIQLEEFLKINNIGYSIDCVDNLF